jgi:hypothetical protein
MLADASTGLRRFERTFNWARLIGAAIALVLGPFFPNLGIVYVAILGVALLANAIAVQLLLPRAQVHYERLSWAAFAADMAIIS